MDPEGARTAPSGQAQRLDPLPLGVVVLGEPVPVVPPGVVVVRPVALSGRVAGDVAVGGDADGVRSPLGLSPT
jgi:hypothetical protein